jgi:poly-gamma-glutamate synthesis protein (capsule biosynthesis protein)
MSKLPNLKSISIKAVGDICPGDFSILGLGVCSKTKKNGSQFIFNNIADHFKETDIVIGNLEGALSRKIDDVKVPNFRFCGMTEFAGALKKTGFNVINVANNHILDNGSEIFEETVNILKSEGLYVSGLKGKNGYYSEPVIIDELGKKIGILGYNWIAKDKFKNLDKYIAQSHDSIVNYTWNRDKAQDIKNQQEYKSKNQNVINDIKKLKESVDFVILYPHWAYEYIHQPPFGVTLEARAFIDAGADAIIGVHPHVIQGYEVYLKKNIFYSLGNFVFDAKSELTRNSMIINLTVNEDLTTDFSYKFVRINNSCQPTPVGKSQTAQLEKIISNSNDLLKSENKKEILEDDKIYREFEQLYNRGKLRGIIQHFRAIFIYPPVILLIVKKFFSFLEIILLRFKGKKVRW